MINMNWWFVALLIIGGISLGIDIERHGKPKTGTDCAWVTLIATLIQVGLVIMAIRAGF